MKNKKLSNIFLMYLIRYIIYEQL